MLTVIDIVLNIILLGLFVLDYLSYKNAEEYEEELSRMKDEQRKMHYEICELEDQLRSHILHV